MKAFYPVFFLFLIASCTPKKKSTEETKEKELPEQHVTSTVSEPKVFFKNIQNGDTVTIPVFVEMGVEGMEVEPAGEVKEGVGHHHILINQTFWPEGKVIPASDSTLHFGKGQTETQLQLDPGQYTISLQFADGVHKSYGESMSASVSIIVK